MHSHIHGLWTYRSIIPFCCHNISSGQLIHKWSDGQRDYFVVTGSTLGCHGDNLGYSHWLQSSQPDYISISELQVLPWYFNASGWRQPEALKYHDNSCSSETEM